MFLVDEYNKWIAELRNIAADREKNSQSALFVPETFTKDIVAYSDQDGTIAFMVAFGNLCNYIFSRTFELSRYTDLVKKTSLLEKETKESLTRVLKLVESGNELFHNSLKSDGEGSVATQAYAQNKAKYDTAVDYAVKELTTQRSSVREYIKDENGKEVVKSPLYDEEVEKVVKWLAIMDLEYTPEQIEKLGRDAAQKMEKARVRAADVFCTALEKEGKLLNIEVSDDTLVEFIKGFLAWLPDNRIKLVAIAEKHGTLAGSYAAILEIDKKQYIADHLSRFTIPELVSVLYAKEFALCQLFIGGGANTSTYLQCTKQQIEALKNEKITVSVPNVTEEKLFSHIIEVKPV
jgi:hypothetical protein